MIDPPPGNELLEAYVADLERRLAAAEPGERADIVASVREHVAADLDGLDRPPTAADVQSSLARLGSVDSVVAAWAPEAASAGPAPGAPATATSPGTIALIVLAVLMAVALAFAFPPLFLILFPTALVGGVMGARRHPENRTAFVVTAVIGGGLTLLVALTILGAFLLVSPSTVVQEGPAVEVTTIAPGG